MLQVKCCTCGYESNTVEGFLDLSLEITRAGTLEKALQRYTAAEYLDQVSLCSPTRTPDFHPWLARPSALSNGCKGSASSTPTLSMAALMAL